MAISTDLTRIKNAKASLKTAINAKGGTLTTELLDSYAAAVDAITGGIDTSDATAVAGDILTGKTAYVNDTKITGINAPVLDWPNIHTIVVNDVQAGYSYKYIYLLADDNATLTLTVSATHLAFKTSDGSLYTSTTTHTWNTTSDIVCADGYKTRWVIVYSNTLIVQVVLPWEVLWVDGYSIQIAKAGLGSFRRLKFIDGTIRTGITDTRDMFSYSSSLTRIPPVLDMASTTLGAGTFTNASCLLRVPDTLDLSHIADLTSIFAGCVSLMQLPDTLNLSAATTTTNMFATLYSLTRLPTTITVPVASAASVTLSFVNSTKVNARYRDTVAAFTAGAVTGGLIYNLTSVTTARALILNSTIKALFTSGEQTTIVAFIATKNWTLTW